jgi:EmrB/QacA subfamily drug resistance transporter
MDITDLTQSSSSREPAWVATDGHPRRGLILGVMCLCLVLVVAAVSSLNVAIPTIVRSLDPSSTEQLWIIDAYAVVFAGLLLLCGALGDRYGRKHALIVGLVIFAGAAMVAAFANDAKQLIAFRAVMGVGAALIMPSTLSTLTVVFAPKDRAKAIATWAGFAGAGAALGPLSSGLLLERFWWGSVFFVAVPIAAMALAAVVVLVPNSADTARHRIDYPGVVLSALALVGLVFGIIEGPEIGWLAPLTLGAFVVSVTATMTYIRWERSVPHPLLDPRLFRVPRFGLGSLTVSMAFLAMFGMLFLLTMYLQFVLGFSALSSSVRLLPFSAVMIAVAPRSPRLTARFGTARVVAVGFLIQATGFGFATQLDAGSGYWLILAAVVPMALGMALLMPPATNAIVTSLPQDKAGVASAVNDATREVGGAIGIALLGTLMTIGYQSGMDGATTELPSPLSDLARDSIGGAAQVASQLDPAAAGQLFNHARSAFVHGATLSFGVAAAIGVVMAVTIARFFPADDANTASDPSPVDLSNTVPAGARRRSP